MSLLNDLLRAGVIRTLDHALAQSLRRLDPATPDEVLAASALASAAVAHGHAAFDPRQPQRLSPLAAAQTLAWPEGDGWLRELAASRWVAPGMRDASSDASCPLVLEDGLLYLRRYREYEHRLAVGVKRLAAQPLAAADLHSLQPLFAQLFPEALQGDRQARAAALALLQSFLLITGGPGTGKTTTIARLLLLLLAQAEAGGRGLRIALAAPTGRAADRMSESLHAAVARLGLLPALPAHLRDTLPTQASTLHRLLGSWPGSTRFRHGAHQPLPFDLVVVDEASMVDLPMMCKLIDAVADGTRLILLGDRDQLPSVEAGDVLAAMGDAAGHGDALPADLVARLAPLLGTGPVPSMPASSPLAGHRVQLQRSFRQSESLDLAPLAEAVRDGDADRAIQLLRGNTLHGVHFHPDEDGPLRPPLREILLGQWRDMAAATDPATALQQGNRLRLMTALRDGPQGASTLNAQIEEALAGPRRDAYFHGRLLLITENSYRLGLFNGDVGICRALPEGGSEVCFLDGTDQIRRFHPAALPAHASAFALTVHKAQGSEFDEAWVVLPRTQARTLSRELLYTALTRARQRVHLFASEDILRATLARRSERVSGLAARLA